MSEEGGTLSGNAGRREMARARKADTTVGPGIKLSPGGGEPSRDHNGQGEWEQPASLGDAMLRAFYEPEARVALERAAELCEMAAAPAVAAAVRALLASTGPGPKPGRPRKWPDDLLRQLVVEVARVWIEDPRIKGAQGACAALRERPPWSDLFPKAEALRAQFRAGCALFGDTPEAVERFVREWREERKAA
jgi:hypothetical protein